MKKLKLLVDWKDKKVGDYINVNEEAAKMCIKEGYAEEISNVLSSPSPECCFSGKALSEPKPELSGSGKAFPDMPNFEEVTDNSEVEDSKNMFFILDDNLEVASAEWIKNNKDKADKQRKRFAEIELKLKASRLQKLPIDNYQDNAARFYDMQPYFYDNSGIFWFWKYDKYCYEIVDDVDIMLIYDDILGYNGGTVNSRIKTNTLEAMKRYGRKKMPIPSKKKWIQFKNKAFSIFSGKIHKVTPDFFFTNPIPYELGETDETPIMDKLFEEWVGKDNVRLLYEIIAYCCYSDYPIHRIFCLVGSGSNGKSRYLALIKKFLGENICASELDDLINNRFESFKLYRKLCCIMGETNFGVLNKTSLLKKLCGQDMIGFEKKNKDPFNDYNYAKILIGSNSLPISEDNTDGFYRRWTIIDFPNQFQEGKDILEIIPEEEYNNLARKCVNLLKGLLTTGKFTNQGSITKRKEKYLLASNPLSIFLKEACFFNPEYYMNYGELYTEYIKYLKNNKKRRIKSIEFKKALEDEGLWVEKTSKKINDSWVSGYWVEGLKLNDNYDNCAPNPTPYTRIGDRVETPAQLSQKAQEITILDEKVVSNSKYFDENQITYHKCSISGCNETKCNFDTTGQPYCEKHWERCAER